MQQSLAGSGLNNIIEYNLNDTVGQYSEKSQRVQQGGKDEGQREEE